MTGENVPRRLAIVASGSGRPAKRGSAPRRRLAILAGEGGDPRTGSSRRRLVILAGGGDGPRSQRKTWESPRLTDVLTRGASGDDDPALDLECRLGSGPQEPTNFPSSASRADGLAWGVVFVVEILGEGSNSRYSGNLL